MKDYSALISRAREGDEAAGKELYLDTVGSVLYIIENMIGDTEKAKELTRDCYAMIFSKIDSLSQPQMFCKWANIVAANVARTYLRRRRPEMFTVSDEERALSGLPSVGDNFLPWEYSEKDEKRDELMKVIRELPDKLKTVVILRYFIEMPVKEIGRLITVGEDTVEMRINAAKYTIAKKLDVTSGSSGGAPILVRALKEDCDNNYIADGEKENIWFSVRVKLGAEALQAERSAAAPAKAQDKYRPVQQERYTEYDEDDGVDEDDDEEYSPLAGRKKSGSVDKASDTVGKRRGLWWKILIGVLAAGIVAFGTLWYFDKLPFMPIDFPFKFGKGDVEKNIEEFISIEHGEAEYLTEIDSGYEFVKYKDGAAMISLTKQYIEKCGFEAGRTYSFDYYGGDELVLYTDFSYNLPEEGQEMVCTGSTAASDESVESACIVYADGSAGIFLSESCFKSEEMPTRFYVLGTDGSEYYDLALSRKIDIDDNFAYCDESFSLEELLGMNETEFERVFVRQSVEGGYKYVINDGRGRTEVTELSVANEKIATTDENMDMFGFKTGQSAAAFQTRCAQKNITLPEDRDYTSDTWVSFEYEDFIFRVIFSGGNISEIDVYADENHLDFDPEAQPGEETGEEDGEEGETETTSTRSSVSDGAYTITLHKSYLKAPGGTMAKANIVSKVSLTDVQARAVQPGDTINLSQYGYTDIKVDTAEFSGDEKLVVNGKYTFVKKGNVWNYVGSSGSAYTYKTGTGDFYFPEGLEITDYTSGTEKTLTDIRDFSGSELNTVSVVVSDGKVTKAIISYKP